MKTLVIFDFNPQTINWFVYPADLTDLQGVYINSDDAENLKELIYDDKGNEKVQFNEFPIPKEVLETVDVCISCGFVL